VSTLASRAGVDLDEALVVLWDAGLATVEDGDTLLPARDVRVAEAALGISLDRARFCVDYWVSKSGLDRATLAQRMASVGVHLSPNSRKIPKNSLRRFQLLFGAQDEPQRETAARRVSAPLPPLEWPVSSARTEMEYLSIDELISIHQALTSDFADSGDPIEPSGVRDEGLLASAANRPLTSYGDVLKYPTVELAGAALFHSVVLNHAFHNGNKRTALVALLAFLDRHGLVVTCTEQALFRETLLVAQHGLIADPLADQFADREVLAIAGWIKSNTRKIERSERPMKFLKLRQRLRDYGCTSAPAGGVGNRLNIERRIETAPLIGIIKRRPTVLHTQVAWAGDGTEADRATLRKIRQDLHLDDAHDVDSATFYAGAEVDAFIIEYRRILKRLAKL